MSLPTQKAPSGQTLPGCTAADAKAEEKAKKEAKINKAKAKKYGGEKKQSVKVEQTVTLTSQKKKKKNTRL
jgi:hypothetical protein